MQSILIEPRRSLVERLVLPDDPALRRDAVRLQLGSLDVDGSISLPNGDVLLAPRLGALSPADWWIASFAIAPVAGPAVIVGKDGQDVQTDIELVTDDVRFIDKADMAQLMRRACAGTTQRSRCEVVRFPEGLRS